MATVNFSVPDSVKEAFNARFKGRNKSAIIADLMQRAVEESERAQRQKVMMQALMDGVSSRPRATVSDIQDVLSAARNAS